MACFEIKNLSFSYPGAPGEASEDGREHSGAPGYFDTPKALQDIDLTVEDGEYVLLCGKSGCGKTTLLRHCKTVLTPHGKREGEILFHGKPLEKSDQRTQAARIGYVMQDPDAQIVTDKVWHELAFGLESLGMDQKAMRLRVAEMASYFGIQDWFYKDVGQLSGGQTHLLALAGAVSLRPEVLILDEPIAQLDPGHADRIYQVLKELNEKHGKTIIVIEHHTEYIADYCKHVMLMRDGNIAWKLPTSQALRRVGELQECNIFPPQVTLAADKLRRQGRLPWERPLPTTIPQGLEAFRSLAYLPPERAPSPPPEQEPAPAVEFQQVSLSYRSVKGADRVVFDGLDLTIRKGDKVALIGSNGAGKSTLLKLMVGLLKPASGDIRLNGESIHRKKTEDLSRQISLVYQNPEQMFIKDSIRADIAFAMEARGVEHYKERTQELLARFRLSPLQERDGRLLSGGQMRRASLAIGVALNPGILLLDEPTANLDIATRKEILRTLGEMKDITDTVVIATHDMQLVCEWAQRIVVLLGGKVVADGPRDEIFGNRALLKEVGIRPPEIFSMGQALEERALCYTVEEFTRYFGEGA